MSKYIDADAVDKIICKKIENTISCAEHNALIDVKFDVEELPAADVERWISVDERLPEANKDCLVYVRYSGFMGMYGCWIRIGHIEKADGEWWGDCMCGKVLYWQYLPEPPKMDGGSE